MQKHQREKLMKNLEEIEKGLKCLYAIETRDSKLEVLHTLEGFTKRSIELLWWDQ